MTELEIAIRAQPAELRRLADLELAEHANRLAEADRVWLVGTGTSLNAAELGAAMFARAGIDARAASSMEFAISPPLRSGDGVVVITHTGETAYAQSARKLALDAGATVLSITGHGVGWPDAVETGSPERSHTYSRSYSSALAVLCLIAGEIGADGLGPAAVLAAADAVEEAIEDPGIEEFPAPARLLVLTGTGPGAVTAREGALKLREAARMLAEGYDAEYLLHGSAVPLGPEDALVVIGAGRNLDGFLAELAAAARSEGVPVVEIDQPEPADELTAQIPLTARLQLLALSRALAGGHDPDRVITGAWDGKKLWGIGAPE